MHYYVIKMGSKAFGFLELTDAVAAFCMLMSAFGIDIVPFEVYATLLEEPSFAAGSCCIMKEPYEKEDLEELMSRYLNKIRDIQHHIFCGA